MTCLSKQLTKLFREVESTFLVFLSTSFQTVFIPIFNLPESAFMAMLPVCCMILHYFFHRARTALQSVPLVCMDLVACPPAPAIITHPALLLMAPASARKVKKCLTYSGSELVLCIIRYAVLAVLEKMDEHLYT